MSTPNGARPDSNRRRLPVKPSEENLRKQAKRRAKADGIPLAEAKHGLAGEYGYAKWADLMQAVVALRKDDDVTPPLHRAARDGNLALAVQLLTAGAHVNRSHHGETALHVAARHGPIELVELLIRHGAREWLKDDAGRLPREAAAENTTPQRDAIVDLLTLPNIRDPHFKAAVAAIHAGDEATLRKLLADHPNLVHDRATEPDCYPPGYFRHPKLVWFVANNPTLIPTMPANIVAITQLLIDAGAEVDDLSYVLELAFTSDAARDQGHRYPLAEVLLAAGATAGRNLVMTVLGHGEREPIAFLLRHGQPITAPIAAGLGRLNDLRRLLPNATPPDVHASLSMAVMNHQPDAARLCLAAGADVNAHVVVHTHAQPIHIAAGAGDLPMLRLLVESGSRLSDRDALWRATPLHWAIHEKRPEAEAYLRSLGAT